MYYFNGIEYESRYGSRAKVMHGTCLMTTGRLMKHDLRYNKRGKIVSIKASDRAIRENRLVKHGFVTKKGVFKLFRIDT
jgi:hypothetical protein